MVYSSLSHDITLTFVTVLHHTKPNILICMAIWGSGAGVLYQFQLRRLGSGGDVVDAFSPSDGGLFGCRGAGHRLMPSTLLLQVVVDGLLLLLALLRCRWHGD